MTKFWRTMTDDELKAALMQATRTDAFLAVAENQLTFFRVENLLGRGTYAVWQDWYNDGELPGDASFAESISLPTAPADAPKPPETDALLRKLVDGQREQTVILKDILSELKRRR